MSSQEKIKLLVDEVIEAFSNVAYPGDDKLVYDNSPEHLECADVASLFRGKHWKDISLELLQYNSESLAFFTPEAYKFYVPAFLIIAISAYDRADLIPRSLLSSLTIPKKDGETKKRFLDKMGLFSADQRAAIRHFLT